MFTDQRNRIQGRKINNNCILSDGLIKKKLTDLNLQPK